MARAPVRSIHSLSWATDVSGTFFVSGQPIPMGSSVPLSKGVAPAVTAANTLYMPFIGPGPASAGLEVIAPSGAPLRRIGPAFPPLAFALGLDGSIYVIGGEGSTPMLVAFSPDGKTRWQHPLHYNGSHTILVGRNDVIYAATSLDTGGEVVAYTPAGRQLWTRSTTTPPHTSSRITTAGERPTRWPNAPVGQGADLREQLGPHSGPEQIRIGPGVEALNQVSNPAVLIYDQHLGGDPVPAQLAAQRPTLHLPRIPVDQD